MERVYPKYVKDVIRVFCEVEVDLSDYMDINIIDDVIDSGKCFVFSFKLDTLENSTFRERLHNICNILTGKTVYYGVSIDTKQLYELYNKLVKYLYEADIPTTSKQLDVKDRLYFFDELIFLIGDEVYKHFYVSVIYNIDKQVESVNFGFELRRVFTSSKVKMLKYLLNIYKIKKVDIILTYKDMVKLINGLKQVINSLDL